MSKLTSQNTPLSDDGEGVWGLSEFFYKYKKEEDAPSFQQWGLVGPNVYQSFPSSKNTLPPGVYMVDMDRNTERIFFMRKDVKADESYRFSESVADDMLLEIDKFWKNHELFKKTGFLHRRGYLLYGPQGTGKSIILQQVMLDVVKRGGIVLLCGAPKIFDQALVTLRKTEPKRNIVCVFEDIDAIIDKFGEAELLAILDGANMVDRVLNLASTNYPEKLDRRIISRPRRFDQVIKVSPPNDKIREEYLIKKLPKKGINIKKWVEGTRGLSFAGVTEAIISVVCLGNGFEETIKKLKELETNSPSSGEFKEGGVGFGAKDKKDKEK
jgi:SpoVK/Ycf46/Vps4 family AAA+-type ATPase